MGGQACVLYGAAEFSRDIDLHILLDEASLAKFNVFIKALKAEVIAVPKFELSYLQAGHAIHFRAHAEGLDGLRIDIMSKMRGVDNFKDVWNRRTVLELQDGTPVNVMSLPDLVSAKKTQRDKDWPMIRRLLEAHYYTLSQGNDVNEEDIAFWFKELRTPDLLIELSKKHPTTKEALQKLRPLLNFASDELKTKLEHALKNEEEIERILDREYWKPLKAELEALRRIK